MPESKDVLTPKKRGSRVLAFVIPILIVLFFVIDFLLRRVQEFSPSKATGILLTALQFIVLLLALILLFVLGRNLARLYLERKRKVVGAHFKTKLVMFFTALSFLPTLLLFLFTSDLISRNIEQWFKMDVNRVLEDTRAVADGFYVTASELTLHYAVQLEKEMRSQGLLAADKRGALEAFVRTKLAEYKLAEIAVYQGEEELFVYLDPNLPLQDYNELKSDNVKRIQAGVPLNDIKPMGTGEFIRQGVSFSLPDTTAFLITTGMFLPQNYTQKINNVKAYWDRYSRRRQQKDLTKTTYQLMLVLVTMLIVFAATWIGFHLARSITVPIEKLAQATREVSKGNLDVRVEDPASDELGILVESFNQMIADIQTGQVRLAQKTAEQEARKQYIETLLNTVTTGVIALDAEGRITTINPSARDMLALPATAEVAGRPYREVLRHPHFAELAQAIEAGMRTRYRISDREITIMLNGQQLTLALTLSPLKPPGAGFSGLLVVLDDLSQLIKSQRVAAWKEVAQRVAHEIKNPLTPIQLNAERILRNLSRPDPASPAALEEGARVIIQEAQTIKSLVDEFSEFARLPKISLQPASLAEIVDQAAALFRPIYNDIEFEVTIDPEVPARQPLDPEPMKRVFINLFDNAIDAMAKKGRIVVRAGFDRDTRLIQVEIEDTGPGIAVEDKDKLFLPHFSTKKKGTGLGLAIVAQIMKEHNGAIDVRNVKPHGARFILQLPA
ncbi:MAG: ATP-binding protein [Candidatus Aminicenantes bacterium]|nr:ATP-binding protein [Candidatus Aminicenantes bacterium]